MTARKCAVTSCESREKTLLSAQKQRRNKMVLSLKITIFLRDSLNCQQAGLRAAFAFGRSFHLSLQSAVIKVRERSETKLVLSSFLSLSLSLSWTDTPISMPVRLIAHHPIHSTCVHGWQGKEWRRREKDRRQRGGSDRSRGRRGTSEIQRPPRASPDSSPPRNAATFDASGGARTRAPRLQMRDRNNGHEQRTRHAKSVFEPRAKKRRKQRGRWRPRLRLRRAH